MESILDHRDDAGKYGPTETGYASRETRAERAAFRDAATAVAASNGGDETLRLARTAVETAVAEGGIVAAGFACIFDGVLDETGEGEASPEAMVAKRWRLRPLDALLAARFDQVDVIARRQIDAVYGCAITFGDRETIGAEALLDLIDAFGLTATFVQASL